MRERKLVSLDWAIKRLLRSKANFVVLEGFLSELLGEDIKIRSVLESESNQETEIDKFNRVDLKVENSKKEIIIIEIQYDDEYDYFLRMLYATSKAVTEHLCKGQDYANVVKVISVNILYFDLGQGKDYIYHGRTAFTGIHFNDQLELSKQQRSMFNKALPDELFPEFYLIKVNTFDDIAKSKLDEWIYFLKNETIKDSFTAKGLQEAAEILDIMKLSKKEREAYERYIDSQRHKRSSMKTAIIKGKEEGEKIGLKKGEKIGLKKGEKIGLKKGEEAGLKKGEKIGLKKGEEAGLKKGEKIGLKKGEEAGLKKGEKIGMKKGIAEGEAKTKVETARKMLQKNMPLHLILELTGLTENDIKKLINLE